jgi:hypothetical protein
MWVDKATTAWFEALKWFARFNMISSAATRDPGWRRHRAGTDVAQPSKLIKSTRSKGAA